MARILVVDDNPSNLELVLYLLRAFGHDARGASDGIHGLETMHAEGFDLVLSDILMPHMDGLELLRQIRANPRTADCSVVAVTASAMVGDRESMMRSGFNGYIAKPIDPETFVGQVDAYLPRELRSPRPWQPS